MNFNCNDPERYSPSLLTHRACFTTFGSWLFSGQRHNLDLSRISDFGLFSGASLMKRFAYLLVGLLIVVAGHADETKPAKAKEPKAAKDSAVAAHDKWTIDGVLLTATAGDFRFSPDGRSVVWVKTAMDKDKGEALSQLMRTDLGDKKEVQLTRGQDSCRSPRWSPDGKR